MRSNGVKVVVAALCMLACFGGAMGQRGGAVKKENFGRTPEGAEVSLFTLTNRRGAEAKIINYGGAIVSLKVPDRRGRMADVVLGFDDLEGYLSQQAYLGVLVGRYANRIANARFTLNGVEYKLTPNDGAHNLHGGPRGFDRRVWEARPIPSRAGAALELTNLSPDGEEGFPGNVRARVVYTLTDQNELRVDYSATTDRDTILNMTQHSYFNLAGEGTGDILNHRLMINAARFTPTDSTAIPTGELRPVRGTPFDFTRPTRIGARIEADDEQLKFGKGYDHNYVINGRRGVLRKAAEAYEPTTGRVMEVWTTEPGVQFYTGNYLAVERGKGGKPYPTRTGFCLETQHYPDSPNRPDFPSVVLRKGGRYRTTTVYRFSAR